MSPNLRIFSVWSYLKFDCFWRRIHLDKNTYFLWLKRWEKNKFEFLFIVKNISVRITQKNEWDMEWFLLWIIIILIILFEIYFFAKWLNFEISWNDNRGHLTRMGNKREKMRQYIYIFSVSLYCMLAAQAVPNSSLKCRVYLSMYCFFFN